MMTKTQPQQPASVLDHPAEPAWDTTQFSDLCLICEWPVSNGPNGWTHDAKNPVHWVDRRSTTAEEHQAAGHDVMVRCGIVMCDTCDRLVLDTSGHRPGLVAANQLR